MAKRPSVSTLSGISREEAESIGKQVTTNVAATPTPSITPPAEPMAIVRVREEHKKRAKAKAAQLGLSLYEYLEQLIDKDNT